jgi:NTP pyrophosphatase (non-canonical NTP hydrolase)
MKNYVELANRTNNSDYNTIITRLLSKPQDYNSTDVEILFNLLTNAINNGIILDGYKKHLFYGRELSEDINLIDETFSMNEELVQKLNNPVVIDIIHAAIGYVTEASEIVEAIFKHLFQGKDLDLVNLTEEVGDASWYGALILKHANKQYTDALKINIEKLAKRFPDGFSDYNANNRDLDSERNILEQ